MASYLIAHDLLVGFPSAPTGTAWFYYPNTTAPVVIYGDSSGTTITNPVTLDSYGSARVYLSQLARMVVQDVNGATVWDGVINGQNDTTTTTTSTAFSATTLQGALNTALAKFGGKDFQYVPSGSVVGMSPHDWMNGLVRNVMAYGTTGATSVNDGVTPADAAIAAAVADVRAAGGGVVYFPPGSYLVNSPIVVAGSSTELRGAGAGATVIKINSGTNDGIDCTASTSFAVRGMHVTATSATTGKSLNVAGTTGVVIDGVTTDGAAVGLYLNNTNNVLVTGNSSIAGSTNGISGTTVITLSVIGGATTVDTSAGAGFSQFYLVGVNGSKTFSSGDGNVVVLGGTGTISFSGGAQPLSFYQYGTGQDGQTLASSAGAFAAIDLAKGPDITLSAGQAAVTVPALTNPPPSTRRDYYVTIRFVNAAGGAVTWTLNAQFKVNTTIPTTDAHTVLVRFLWDGANSKFREVSRADTAT